MRPVSGVYLETVLSGGAGLEVLLEDLYTGPSGGMRRPGARLAGSGLPALMLTAMMGLRVLARLVLKCVPRAAQVRGQVVE